MSSIEYLAQVEAINLDRIDDGQPELVDGDTELRILAQAYPEEARLAGGVALQGTLTTEEHGYRFSSMAPPAEPL